MPRQFNFLEKIELVQALTLAKSRANMLGWSLAAVLLDNAKDYEEIQTCPCEFHTQERLKIASDRSCTQFCKFSMDFEELPIKTRFVAMMEDWGVAKIHYEVFRRA